MQNYARISFFGILALIALRVGIGWHFYMEGVAKVRGNNFSSVGFLNAAKGPLKDKFQAMIWDKEGQVRLNEEFMTRLFNQAAEDATAHFALTDDQQKSLDRVRAQTTQKLSDLYAAAGEELNKYNKSVERVATMKDSKMWNEVASLRGQRDRIEKERSGEVRDTLASVDAIWKQYEGRLNSVANLEQQQQAGYFTIARPGEGLLSTRFVDQVIPIFDMSVGILLIIGLLTPLASWAAALFLINVILTQMPGYPGTEPTYYQAIECLALITLATTDAGRYAGLDFLPWYFWQKKSAGEAATA